ncbi:MAG: OPT/YSL family transporter [Candidatus Hermodarchaeia archaeon]
MTDSEHLGDELGPDGYQPEPICDTDTIPPEEHSGEPSARSLTTRGIALAIVLNIVYTTINAYLGMNFGFGLGFGIITVLTAYTLFQVMRGNSSRQELTTTMIASTGFVVYWVLSVSIYVQAYTLYTLPWWLAPPQEVLLSGSALDPRWIPPIIFHLGWVILATFLGFIAALAVVDYVQTRKQTKFPFYLASGVTIDTCMQTGQRSRFMFWALGIGILITAIQYWGDVLLQPFGLSTISLDLTPLLPPGFALGFLWNISLMAISFIIDSKISITLLFAGLITYLVISPILVVQGLVVPGATGMDMYFNLLFAYTISPALGIMLLSGIVVFLVVRLRTRIRPPKQKKESDAGSPDIGENQSLDVDKPDIEETGNVGFGDFAKAFIFGLVRNRRLGFAYLLITAIFVTIVVGLNVFSPFPSWIAILISLLLLLPVALIDTFVMVKFVGEAGLGMGAQRLAFYEIPLAITGLEGYVPFMAYAAINPYTTTDTLGNMKIGMMTETPRRSILIAQLLKIFPGAITSVIFVLAAWYLIGFPSETFPAVGVLQGYAIVSIFATGGMGGGFDILSFLIAGGLVGVLAVFTPIAPLGVALAMFLPPSYFIPFSIGGFLRLYTNRKYGKEWFSKRGQVIAVGFIAGAAITQVIVAFMIPWVQLWALPICIVILVILLWRYRNDSPPSENINIEENNQTEEPLK